MQLVTLCQEQTLYCFKGVTTALDRLTDWCQTVKAAGTKMVVPQMPSGGPPQVRKRGFQGQFFESNYTDLIRLILLELFQNKLYNTCSPTRHTL